MTFEPDSNKVLLLTLPLVFGKIAANPLDGPPAFHRKFVWRLYPTEQTDE
ncbi:hypothetical protein SAMN05192569_102325 [Parageobacillus thermantarcticus]|uniref:Uncharacterized protein n=1 Tax=Parageobacillus thermantarcticus TaxID=186116 RepID=A0A1I0TDS2_9BACL|nr:hypothetical protein SAMN05192569_102325 [Parageobacillus thermantarcticus]